MIAGRRLAVAVAVLVTGAALGAFAARRVRRIEVHGPSMRPTLEPGDRLVVVRVMGPRPGDIVAVEDPRNPGHVVVKRVTAVHGHDVVVHGDNAGESTDSRHFGPVDRAAVRGRAVYRYWPPTRRGRVPLRPRPALSSGNNPSLR